MLSVQCADVPVAIQLGPDWTFDTPGLPSERNVYRSMSQAEVSIQSHKDKSASGQIRKSCFNAYLDLALCPNFKVYFPRFTEKPIKSTFLKPLELMQDDEMI